VELLASPVTKDIQVSLEKKVSQVCVDMVECVEHPDNLERWASLE
jgi:hypothetical protein